MRIRFVFDRLRVFFYWLLLRLLLTLQKKVGFQPLKKWRKKNSERYSLRSFQVPTLIKGTGIFKNKWIFASKEDGVLLKIWNGWKHTGTFYSNWSRNRSRSRQRNKKNGAGKIQTGFASIYVPSFTPPPPPSPSPHFYSFTGAWLPIFAYLTSRPLLGGGGEWSCPCFSWPRQMTVARPIPLFTTILKTRNSFDLILLL